MPDGPASTEPPHPDDYLTIFHRAFAALDWESHRGHEHAIFRTFAIPSISAILDQTGEFACRGQKRYDDTVALLRELGRYGPDSSHGHAAIKHLNGIHRPYDITNADLLYVLATFVVVPVEWIRLYGWRHLTEEEIQATVTYYQALGRLMGIREIPRHYAEFASYLDDYERGHRSFTEANRRLTISLIKVMAAWFPQALRPLARGCIAAALGRPLRQALGLPEPSVLIGAGVHVALRSRAALTRMIPALRHQRKSQRRLRTYPCGYALNDIGPAWTAGRSPDRLHAP